MTDREHADRDAGRSGGSGQDPQHPSEPEHDRKFEAGDEPPGRDRQRQRKERVLHTRISEQLAADIRHMADDLRVPVSNLVRNVLEEAFSVVESVSDDVGDLLEDVIEQAERASHRVRHFQRRRRERDARDAQRRRPEPPESQDFTEVEAWQPVILNAPRRCAADGREIRRGEQAFVGLTASGVSDTTLCPDCVEARQ
jgi:hypothetical protein